MISEEISRELRDVGLDTDEMIVRFMNSEDMFRRYFLKFFEAAEPVVAELEGAVKRGDIALSIKSAHALKGLSGNIGLNGVFLPAKKIVDDLRAGKTDEYADDFAEAYGAYTSAYAVSKRM